MASISLDMDDIFDRDHGRSERDEDEDVGHQHAGLPDLDFEEEGAMRPSQGEDNQNEGQPEGDEVLSNLKNLSKGAAKKRVTRPQPKLDPQRLKSSRGLPALPKLFKDVRFRGKGYEADDLKVLMSNLEHWAHRLFPKMPFDEFIERLEKLGGKKEMQTTIKRIRLDMPILDEDFVGEKDDEGADKKDAVDDDDDVAMEDATNAEEAYERMIRQQEEREAVNLETVNIGRESGSKDAEVTDGDAAETDRSAEMLREQQRERMERNRLLALQKRAQKFGLPLSSQSSQIPPSSSTNFGCNRGDGSPFHSRQDELNRQSDD